MIALAASLSSGCVGSLQWGHLPTKLLCNLASVCSALQTWVGMSPADAEGTQKGKDLFSNQINIYFSSPFDIFSLVLHTVKNTKQKCLE